MVSCSSAESGEATSSVCRDRVSINVARAGRPVDAASASADTQAVARCPGATLLNWG